MKLNKQINNNLRKANNIIYTGLNSIEGKINLGQFNIHYKLLDDGRPIGHNGKLFKRRYNKKKKLNFFNHRVVEK